MKNIKKSIISSFVFILILMAIPLSQVRASSIGFSPSSGTYKVGDTINVKVYVGTDKSINAIAANVSYPTDLLSLSSISKTGSVLNLWAQEPSFSNDNGVASFEGVILNGYTGNSGNAVTLIFKAKAVGAASLKFNTASILANDGNGTETLSSKGSANLNIVKPETKLTPKVETKEPVKKLEVVKDFGITISEIKNSISQYSPNRFLITAKQKVADDSYVIQIDNMPSIIWTDDGTHIYQSPELKNGIHNIKVTAVDIDSNELKGALNFYTTFLQVPAITYYPKNLYVDDLMVLKGVADPAVDVELTITNTETNAIIINHVSTNGDGKFTYVPDNKIPAGTYSITARSFALSGMASNYMDPIQVVNRENKVSWLILIISKYLTLLIPLIALLILIIILIIYGYYHARRLHNHLNKKLSSAEEIVAKSFEILEEDEEEEVAIFRKIRANKSLNEEEAIFLNKFKKDIKEAEKIIQKELREVGKSNTK